MFFYFAGKNVFGNSFFPLYILRQLELKSIYRNEVFKSSEKDVMLR